MSNYYRNKAIYAKKLHDEGKPFVKVYAPVRVGDKFMVLRDNVKGTYHLSGGGVDEGETIEQAIKRELREELGVEVDVIGEIALCEKIYPTWVLDDESFEVEYEIHLYDTKLKAKIANDFGLPGEFTGKNVSIVEIDKDTLLKNIWEFNHIKEKKMDF